MKKKVAVFTLGCKSNYYDSEAIAELFKKEGYEIVDFDDLADVYVINTCTVTSLGDRKSRQVIRKARKTNPDAVVVVTGCYAQVSPQEVAQLPEVNLVIGTGNRQKIVELVKALEKGQKPVVSVGDIMRQKEFEGLGVEEYQGRTRAFVKIQDGCSQFCSYCIIPFARGPARSRPPEEIVKEVKGLAARGFKEVVLTGIHIASYGKDLGGLSLMDVVKALHELEGVLRIRLGSLDPRVITPEFVKTARELPKLCPHYHVSLQSGSDEVLKRMNRKYTAGEYRDAAAMLRESIADVAITTDVMVGFPGETDDLFDETYRFLDELSLSRMHVFKYSPRKGTAAARFKDQVPPEKKEERSNRLIALAREKSLLFNRGFVGRVMPVLYEQELDNRPGVFEGTTSNYIRVIAEGNNMIRGNLLDTEIIEAGEDFATGRIRGVRNE